MLYNSFTKINCERVQKIYLPATFRQVIRLFNFIRVGRNYDNCRSLEELAKVLEETTCREEGFISSAVNFENGALDYRTVSGRKIRIKKFDLIVYEVFVDYGDGGSKLFHSQVMESLYDVNPFVTKVEISEITGFATKAKIDILIEVTGQLANTNTYVRQKSGDKTEWQPIELPSGMVAEIVYGKTGMVFPFLVINNPHKKGIEIEGELK